MRGAAQPAARALRVLRVLRMDGAGAGAGAQVDGWRRRYPTHVGDVAGACVALAELRRQHAAVGVRRGPGGGGGG